MQYNALIFFLLSLLKTCDSFWHAYNKTQRLYPKANHCPDYRRATRPLADEEIAAKALWPGLMKDFDRQHGEVIYGLRVGLDEIWRNQFPANCSNAKFLISDGWPWGFGSRFHVEGIGLAIAMQLGRVYLMHPDAKNVLWETNNTFCKAHKRSGFDCYFQPISNCTIQDAYDSEHNNVNAFPITHCSDFSGIFDDADRLARVEHELDDHKGLNLVYLASGSLLEKNAIPFSVRDILDCSPMQQHLHYYWWRAITAAFFFRPNQPTLTYVAKYRQAIPLNDSEQCIAMLVRHGDKAIEMKLIDFVAYAETAKMMWEQGYVPIHNRTVQGASFIKSLNTSHTSAFPFDFGNAADNEAKNCTIFLATEDPIVISESQVWSAQNGCRVMYTNLFDRATSIMRYDYQTQHSAGVQAGHHGEEYLSMILNLEFTSRCEAWVCTLASNYCRVMDEMRATVGAKANRFFADLSKETCRSPPCVGTESSEIYDFGY